MLPGVGNEVGHAVDAATPELLVFVEQVPHEAQPLEIGADDLAASDALLANQAGAFEDGDVLLDGARRRVRVDTGELRDSLHLVVEQGELSLETNNDHAVPNEFGTHQMPAQSFIRATVDEDGGKAIEALANVLGRQIEQVAQ